jgi:hypothetical protein
MTERQAGVEWQDMQDSGMRIGVWVSLKDWWLLGARMPAAK